jgi:hypothetical protein
MDISELVRAKRRCGTYAWVGYIIASFLMVFAITMPWLFTLVAVLFIASYSMTRGSRLGAVLHSTVVGILLTLLVLDNPQEPFKSLIKSLTRWMRFPNPSWQCSTRKDHSGSSHASGGRTKIATGWQFTAASRI